MEDPPPSSIHGDAPARTTMTRSSPISRFGWAIPPALALTYAVLLLAFHVTHAEPEELRLLQRMQEGPIRLSNLDLLLFCVLILLALETLQFLTGNSGRWLGTKLIPVRGKHLDELSMKDRIFIGANKLATTPFVYVFLRYCYFEPNILWDPQLITMKNTLWRIPVLFVVYDFFYTILHWALHIKAIYGYIHKHHHHQKAPSRSTADAVNVHPLEFFLGEYNHLWAVIVCCRVLDMQVHVASGLALLAIGGILAGLNHTRYDVTITLPFVPFTIYDSKNHDVHHRIPQSNYGQYFMLWDYLFGSYRPYDPKDRINPDFQLDPTTGKSLAYMKQHPKLK